MSQLVLFKSPDVKNQILENYTMSQISSSFEQTASSIGLTYGGLLIERRTGNFNLKTSYGNMLRFAGRGVSSSGRYTTYFDQLSLFDRLLYSFSPERIFNGNFKRFNYEYSTQFLNIMRDICSENIVPRYFGDIDVEVIQVI